MPQEVSQEVIDEIKQIYSDLDTDCCGSLDREQLKEALRRFTYMNFPDDQIEEIMKYFDTNQDGRIDIAEFIKLLAKLK